MMQLDKAIRTQNNGAGRVTGEDLLVTVCQADPTVEFTLTQTPSYNPDNAFDIFRR